MSREIPIEALERVRLNDIVILCNRGSDWFIEKDGKKAGSFIYDLMGQDEKLYAGQNGSLFASSDGGKTAAATFKAVSAKLFKLASRIKIFRNITDAESYQTILANAEKRKSTIDLVGVSLSAAAKLEAERRSAIEAERKVIWSNGKEALVETEADICSSWAAEAIARIADPSHDPEIEIPHELVSEILENVRRETGGHQPEFGEMCADIDYAESIIRDTFADDLVSEAEFYRTSTLDEVVDMLGGVKTDGCVVLLRNITSGECEYLFRDLDTYDRVQPRSVGELISMVAGGKAVLSDGERHDIEFSIARDRFCLAADPDRAHGDMRFEVMFIAKSVSDEVIAMDDDELAYGIAQCRLKRDSPAENLVARLAEERGCVLNVERDICSIFGWGYSSSGRMESLNELMESMDAICEPTGRPNGRSRGSN